MCERNKETVSYNRADLIGKHIKLFPADTHPKHGIIRDINELGYFIEITRVENGTSNNPYQPGDLAFYNHASHIQFIIKEAHVCNYIPNQTV